MICEKKEKEMIEIIEFHKKGHKAKLRRKQQLLMDRAANVDYLRKIGSIFVRVPLRSETIFQPNNQEAGARGLTFSST